jgi:hypothetical protein
MQGQRSQGYYQVIAFEAKKNLLARNAFMAYYYLEVDTSILNVTVPKWGR